MKDLAEAIAVLFTRLDAVEQRVHSFEAVEQRLRSFEAVETRLRAVDELDRRIRDFDALERRVRALEQHSAPGLPEPGQVIDSAAPLLPAEIPSGEQISSIFLVLGKALLGIAGAYVLRALEESAVLPRMLVAGIAIVYAIAWLIVASRATPLARFAAVLYSGTSALILAPMLWELTMRFHVLAPMAAAAVLGLYVAVATLQAWRRHSSFACPVATAAAALTALALSIVTHVMLPFLVLLLAMVAINEYRASRGLSNGARMLIAAVADCTVWILLYLYRVPPSAGADYPATGTAVLIAIPGLLFLLAASGVVFRAVVLRKRITAFDSTQAVIAFLLAGCGPLLVIPNASPRVVGVICLVFGSACYAAAFRIFRGDTSRRNFRVFTLWSAALTLAGAFLTFPQSWAASALALAAVVCIAAVRRLNCIALEAHAAVYLAVAASTSGLLTYAFQSLAGVMPSTVSPAILLVSACALICYASVRELDSENWRLQLLHLLLAALAAGCVTSLISQALSSLVALAVTTSAFHIAFLRTLVLCGIALALALAGSHWHRLQMRRVAYAVLSFLAAKLVFEDLRHGHLAFIAASIFLFALTLIAVPRLARSR